MLFVFFMIRRCSGAVAAGHVGALVRLHGQVRLLRQHGRAGLRRPRQLLLAAQSILHVLHTCTRLHYDAALCVCCKFHIAVGQHRIGREPLMCSGVLDRSRSAQNRSRALDVFRCLRCMCVCARQACAAVLSTHHDMLIINYHLAAA